jgi:hypothetical protein
LFFSITSVGILWTLPAHTRFAASRGASSHAPEPAAIRRAAAPTVSIGRPAESQGYFGRKVVENALPRTFCSSVLSPRETTCAVPPPTAKMSVPLRAMVLPET